MNILGTNLRTFCLKILLHGHAHEHHTGLFKSNLYTLTGNYDKYTVYTEKIMVYFFSVHMEISFHDNKSEKI